MFRPRKHRPKFRGSWWNEHSIKIHIERSDSLCYQEKCTNAMFNRNIRPDPLSNCLYSYQCLYILRCCYFVALSHLEQSHTIYNLQASRQHNSLQEKAVELTLYWLYSSPSHSFFCTSFFSFLFLQCGPFQLRFL